MSMSNVFIYSTYTTANADQSASHCREDSEKNKNQ